MTNIRHFWVASNSRYLTIYKAILPSFVKKNYKKSLLCGLISQTSTEMRDILLEVFYRREDVFHEYSNHEKNPVKIFF
jgi:hypothetical protein